MADEIMAEETIAEDTASVKVEEEVLSEAVIAQQKGIDVAAEEGTNEEVAESVPTENDKPENDTDVNDANPSNDLSVNQSNDNNEEIDADATNESDKQQEDVNQEHEQSADKSDIEKEVTESPVVEQDEVAAESNQETDAHIDTVVKEEVVEQEDIAEPVETIPDTPPMQKEDERVNEGNKEINIEDDKPSVSNTDEEPQNEESQNDESPNEELPNEEPQNEKPQNDELQNEELHKEESKPVADDEIDNILDADLDTNKVVQEVEETLENDAVPSVDNIAADLDAADTERLEELVEQPQEPEPQDVVEEPTTVPPIEAEEAEEPTMESVVESDAPNDATNEINAVDEPILNEDMENESDYSTTELGEEQSQLKGKNHSPVISYEDLMESLVSKDDEVRADIVPESLQVAKELVVRERESVDNSLLQEPLNEALEVSVNINESQMEDTDKVDMKVPSNPSSGQVSVPDPVDTKEDEEESDFEILEADVETQLPTDTNNEVEAFDFEEQMAKYQHEEPEPEMEAEPQNVSELKRISVSHAVPEPVELNPSLYVPSPAPEPHRIPELDIEQRQKWAASGPAQPERLNRVRTKEIGVQTIILATELKLGSSTKRKIAQELGYYVPAKRDHKSGSSMSPILASKQMKSSSQKIAKIINEHKAQLKVIFDRYSNGLTNKIKLDGLTKMLKDRNILKKLSLVPEITKAFHKSSFTKVTPDSLTFDEFIQCIIRLANDLLSRKKKSKYKTAESRVSLFLAKLHLRPFPKDDEVESLSHIVEKDRNQKGGSQPKTIAQDFSPNIHAAMSKNPNARDPHSVQMQYDYRLSEKQLDSEFDNYFNTGGFFSDANSHGNTQSHTPSVPSSAGAGPVEDGNAHKMASNAMGGGNERVHAKSPKFKNGAADHRRKQRSHSGHVVPSPQKQERGQHGQHGQHRPVPPNRRAANDVHAARMKRGGSHKRVKPSPFAKQGPKKRLSSYQELYQSTNDPMTHQMAQQRLAQEISHEIQRSPLRGNHAAHHQSMHSPLRQNQHYKYDNMQHGMAQQPRQQMMSPTNSMYPQHHSFQQTVQQQPSQEYSQNASYDMAPQNGYNDYYEPQQRVMQHPQAPMQHEQYQDYERQERELAHQIHHLTEQEQRVVRSIHQRQQSQLNRAVPRHRSNSYGRR